MIWYKILYTKLQVFQLMPEKVFATKSMFF